MQTTIKLTSKGVMMAPSKASCVLEVETQQAADHDKRASVQKRRYLENLDASRVDKQLPGIVAIDDAEHSEHDDRKRSDDYSAQTGLGRKRIDLKPQPLPRAHDLGQPANDHREAASNFTLHLHGYD